MRQPTHPGAILREDVIPALDRPKTEIAAALGVSRQHLDRILNEEKPVTVEMSLRLGKLCGNGPDVWINMQTRFDIWTLSRDKNMKATLRRVPTLQMTV